MRATYMYGAGDVRVIDTPDPMIQQSTDALVRMTRACVCGSDLHPFHSMPATTVGSPMGHEFIGVVEETGSEVTSVGPGDFVIAPFAVSCGACSPAIDAVFDAVMCRGVLNPRGRRPVPEELGGGRVILRRWTRIGHDASSTRFATVASTPTWQRAARQ